jgi:hypothetical protein
MAKEKIKQLLDILSDDDINILEDAFYISKEVARKNIIQLKKMKDIGNGYYGIDSAIKKEEYNYAKCTLVLSMFSRNKPEVKEIKSLNKYN